MDRGELCDDGNSINGDACSNACTFTIASAGFCGDGILQLDRGEQCDDRNGLPGDGCSGTCLSEALASCGNLIPEGSEECDDGNPRNGDGCSSFCFLEAGRCGDGIRQAALGETCDDANIDSGDGCNTACQLEIPPANDLGYCGDAIVQTGRGERCDSGQLNGNIPSSCRTNCLLPVCGDGITDLNERCDDRNRLDGDGCSALCEREAAAATDQSPSSAPQTGPDQDSDGVPDVIENACFNSGDGNGDGTPDSRQPDVACVRNLVTGGSAAIMTGQSCPQITSALDLRSELMMPVQDATYEYPVGLAEFTLHCTTPYSTTRVTVYHDRVFPTGNWVYRKFNPNTNVYTDLMRPIEIVTKLVGTAQVTAVSYDVTDNDGVTDYSSALGDIHDPAGPAIAGSFDVGGSVITPAIPPRQPDTGPGFLIFLASGAAAGIGFVRRLMRRYA